MNGFDNLSAMEIDPSSAMTEMMEQGASHTLSSNAGTDLCDRRKQRLAGHDAGPGFCYTRH